MKENGEREKRIGMEDVHVSVESSKEDKHTCALNTTDSITSENFGGNAITDDFGRFEEIRTNERTFTRTANQNTMRVFLYQ